MAILSPRRAPCLIAAAALSLGSWGIAAEQHAVPFLGTRPEPTTVSLQQACRVAGVRYPPPALRLIVRKGERRLVLASGRTSLKEYRVGLGPVPAGHKEQEGDGRTPEGEYYVCTRLERSRFRHFLGLSYPGVSDAHRGLRTGLLSRGERDRILDAQRARKQPPWSTRLGGAVGIHGSGAGSDWTAGCVAVEDRDIDELFAVVGLGTPVTIQP